MRKLKVTEMGRKSVEEFKDSHKMPLVVVLDHVRSLYNVGSVFRTSDAFLVQGICLCGITAQPPHPEIHKTALGAEDSVEWKYFEQTQDAVNWLKTMGYTVLAIEQCEGSTMLQNFQPDKDKKYAVVLGNEVKGVQQEVVDMCDGCIEIPQFGTKHSMNVSVTAGIIIWSIASARHGMSRQISDRRLPLWGQRRLSLSRTSFGYTLCLPTLLTAYPDYRLISSSLGYTVA